MARARRWLKWLAALGVVLALSAWWIDRQLQPQRLVTTVLGQLGPSLALDLRFDGEPEYALRPEPRLVIPNLDVRDRRDGARILSARRAEFALPWATLTGGAAVITRIELDAPVLEVAALQRWLAARPPTPFKLPTFTRGLRVTNGTVHADGFALHDLGIELKQLREGTPTQASLSGRVALEDLTIPFDAVLDADMPGLASPIRLGLRGTWPQGSAARRFALDATGRYEFGDTRTTLDLGHFDLHADSPLPTLAGKAALALDTVLTLDLSGRLAQWPTDWPALPRPLSAQAQDLPLELHYRGNRALTDPLVLTLHKDGTDVDARVRVAQLQAWLDAPPGNPLPPLALHARTPKVEVDGATIEGLEVELRDEAPAEKAP